MRRRSDLVDLVIAVARRPMLAALAGAAFLSVAGSGCGAGQAGGAGGSGGTAQATGGAAGQAGTGSGGAGTAGTTATGRGGTMGRPPPQPVLSMMSPGWNLGNSFDA